jgi:hypothetical protein
MGNFIQKFTGFLAFLLVLSVNSGNAQTNVSGVISTNTNWTKAGSPYNVTGNLLVNSGVKLTIEDGVNIKVNGGFYIKIEGILDAVGLTTSKIIFESSSATPSKSNWIGIQIRPTGGSVINPDLTFVSGTRIKNVIVKNANKGIYVYSTGLFISNSEFIDNEYGVEIRSTDNVLIDNCLFTSNNYGVYTDYESSSGDGTSGIQNTFIQNSKFNYNSIGNYFFLNQREFKNLNVNDNIYKNNQTGVVFSGGGYGCRVHSVLIKKNTFIDNTINGLEVGQIYGEGSSGSLPAFPLIVEKNVFVNDGVLWSYGGGISGVASKFVNNIIINKGDIGLLIKGQTSKSDLFNKNFIFSNLNGIIVQGLYGDSYLPSNKTFAYNSFFANSSNPVIKIKGSGMVIKNNNFKSYNSQLLLQVDGVDNINSNDNYWDKTDRTLIAASIFDKNDNFELGEASITTILSSKEITAPIYPTNNVTKSITAGQVVLTWKANTESDIAGYKIYYGGYTGYSYTNVIDAGNVLTYTLPAGVSIDENISVTAYDASKTGTDDQLNGNESWYSPANKAPAIAVISTIIPTERQVQLNWGVVTNANKYNIYKSTDSSTFTLLTSVTGTTYTDASLNTLQQRYYYKVAAFDSLDLSYDNYGLEGPHSAIKGAKPTNKPTISSVESFTDLVKLNFTYNSNLAGITNVKVYRSSPTQARALIATLAASAATFTNTVTNDIPYSYDVTITNATDESDKSEVIIASGFSVPISVSPIADQLDIKTTQIYKWSKNTTATRYLIQFDTVNTFNSAALIEKTITDTSSVIQDLIQNQYYLWRIKSGDANGFSNWSSVNRFQSYVKDATIDNVIAANKNDTLKFTIPSIKNISKIYILRDTVDNPVKIIDSISSVTSLVNTYNDTIQLKLNQKYFYSIQLFNSQGVKSAYATSKNATPYNTKPKTASLENKVFDNVGEYNFVRSTYSSLGSKDLDGKIVNYNWYVNDSLVNSTDSILIYYYNQGTNDLKLVITDNDGAKDSTTAKVTLNAFLKTFKGGLLGGVTALNPNKIYTADSTFDPVNGASILMLDRLGNTIYPLVVSSKIFTTPSVSSDSSVFITSGSSLNGFSKTGAPLWSTIPLGGNSFVTPTIDSLLTRIYLGVSNKNFFAIDYNTGKVAWNILSDAPINTSAVITGDRKLVFISQLGTLYGYDIRTNIAHTASKWKYSIGEIVSKSPAVDGGNNLYIGTDAGNLVKLTLKEDSSVTKVWSIKLKGAIQTSAVIDGDGFVYIGDEVGDFYKINPNDGSIIWTYSSGAAIRSTPAISDFGSIYFANMNGLVTAIDSNKSIKWKYKDSSPISANLLYINNMIYAGTESGKFFAIFDNPTSKTVNTTLSVAGTETISKVSNIKSFSTTEISVPKVPIWGTFQGNYRRTGSRNFDCPDKPIIKIPSCAQNADSIRVSTDNMKQRYWLLNEVKLETIDTVLFIKPSDKIKLIAYNSNGCNVSSVETAAIPNSDVPKPIIVTNTGTDKFCQTDSIIMSSKLNAKSYQWNYAGFPISNAKSKTLVTNLSGAYSVTLVNDYGCKSTSDISLIMAIQKPSAPSISRDTSGSLISSSVTGNQWYKEGIAVTGATSRLYKPGSPGIFNVSSNNQGCMSTLSTPYYFIVTNVINLGSNEFIKLAPNPVKNQMNIDFVVKGYQGLNIDFYEISTGLLKYSNKGVFAGSQLYLGQLSPGTYVVSVRSEDGKVAHKLKVIKL